MEKRRKNLITAKAIGFLLIAAIVINALLPVHYHLHHRSSPDAAQHKHSIDLHTPADESHHDEGANIFDATPQGMSKKFSKDQSPLVLLTLILLLLPLLDTRTLSRVTHHFITLKQNHFHLYPPLRAPPQ